MFDRELLTDKVVLISGATQGLGAGIARAAAREGAAGVAITGRNQEKGAAVREELTALGTEALYLPVDLMDIAAARDSVHRTIEHFGRLDSVVNSAGLTTRGSVLDTTPELFDQHMTVNVKAPFFIMSETIGHLREAGRPGTIVNIISTSEYGGAPHLAPYAISKAGLATATRNAAHAHRWDRIRINGLNIGWTETEGEDATQKRFHDADEHWVTQANAQVPMGKLGQIDEIADFVVLLMSSRSGVVTGSVIDWDQMVQGVSN